MALVHSCTRAPVGRSLVFHATGFGVADVPDTLSGNCGDNPGIACRLAWDLTHSANATQLVRVYLAGPVTEALRIAFVVVVALVVRALAHRVINRITERAARVEAGSERREQRARALGS